MFAQRGHLSARQVLVLKHEASQEEELLPYLASTLFPTPIVQLEGRSARKGPACPLHEAVYWGWVDTVVPAISSWQAPEDTVFFVFEADFRFSPAHSEACRLYFDRMNHRTFQLSSTQREADVAAFHPTNWAEHVAPHARAGNCPISPLMEDLVSLANGAAQCGRGEFIWLSWIAAASKGKTRPSRATTAVALTKAFASGLLPWLRNQKPGHLDVILADGLCGRRPDLPGQLATCYLYPPMGGFQKHVSGCEPNLMREEEWGANVEYTRSIPELAAGKEKEKRWYCSYRTGGAWTNWVKDQPTGPVAWLTGVDPELCADMGEPDRALIERDCVERTVFSVPGMGGSGRSSSSTTPDTRERTRHETRQLRKWKSISMTHRCFVSKEDLESSCSACNVCHSVIE